MRRLCAILVLAAAACLPAAAQDIYARYNGSCQQGGAPSTTNGINSVQDVQLSYPFCTITVFNHGTIVQASIFNDAAGTSPIVQPIVATSTGAFAFYAANGRYDALLSGGGLPSSFTISDITLCFTSSCGGGGSSITLQTNGTNNSSQTTLNILNGTGITFTNTSGGSVQGVLNNTAVTPAAYTCANLTVDQQGRLTAAANGSCGGGGTPGTPLNSLQGNNASAFAGVPNTSLNFSTGRVDINNLSNGRYVTPAYNWLQTPGGSLTGGTPATVTLTPCPIGVAGTDTNLYTYLSNGTGTAEPVVTTGGSCTSGAASGTVQFTPVNSHTGAWTIGSASGGIYEALKDATATNVNNAHIILAPTNPPASVFYSVYAPITISGSDIDIDGSGAATIDCNAKTACFKTSGSSTPHIHGMRLAVHTNYAGVAITNTACASNASTITTTLNPSVGEYVDIQATFNHHYWGVHQVATTSGSSWTYTDTNCGGSTTITADNSTGGNAYLNAFAMIGFGSNASGSTIDHIDINAPGGFAANTVNNLIVVGNDQAFHAHDITMSTALAQCTANYCANLIYAPGPFSVNSAVVYVDHINATLSCLGNGITSYSGNTLSVSDAVIQGFAEWAIGGGTSTGGFGTFTLANVYNEVGGCSNPQYPGSGLQVRAEAGLLLQGGGASIRGGEFPIGSLPKFAATGNGNTQYNYWIVVHDSSLGTSSPLVAGYASVDSVTPTGSIVVSWPRVPGTATITYDVLRNTGTGNSLLAPYNGGCAGGSTTACGSIATAQAQCSTYLCSFTDTASTATSSYALTSQAYYPFLPFWPGGLVLSNSGDAKTDSATTVVSTDSLGFITNVSPITSVFGTATPSINTPRCDTGVSGVWVSCLAGNPSGGGNPGVGGVLLQNGPSNSGGATPNIKGRINLLNNTNVGINTFHLLTLVDSNPGKTLATPFGRPTNDANDTFIGLDQGAASNASAQLTFGAPVAISRYIANVGDGTSWKERLTSSLLEYKVPHQFDGSTSGSAQIGVAAIAGTPNKLLLPTSTGSANAILQTDGNSPQQSSWTLTPSLTSVTASGTVTASQVTVTGGPGTISPASTTVAALPSAATHAGAIITVSDSTPIATEGQTCVGSSGNVALAFSNGSTWSCYGQKVGGAAAGLAGTGACATFGTQTGGAFSGQSSCTGTTGASTITITPGTTATNGWVCAVYDQTTRANLLQQTANGPTTCTLTATSVTANDVFVFTATPF